MKAQSISINTIVIAAIALVVMVLVVMIFTNSITKFRHSADDCYANRGNCVTPDKCVGAYSIKRTEFNCYKPGTTDVDSTKVCCLST